MQPARQPVYRVPVLLYAYKLGNVMSFQSYPWHVSVVVFECEITYGADGLFVKKIDEEPDEMKIMGHTTKTSETLYYHLQGIKKLWTMDTYDVLTNNCQNFAEKLLHFLGINQEIPHKYTNLPRSLRSMLGSLQSLPGKCIKSSKSLSQSTDHGSSFLSLLSSSSNKSGSSGSSSSNSLKSLKKKSFPLMEPDTIEHSSDELMQVERRINRKPGVQITEIVEHDNHHSAIPAKDETFSKKENDILTINISIEQRFLIPIFCCLISGIIYIICNFIFY